MRENRSGKACWAWQVSGTGFRIFEIFDRCLTSLNDMDSADGTNRPHRAASGRTGSQRWNALPLFSLLFSRNFPELGQSARPRLKEPVALARCTGVCSLDVLRHVGNSMHPTAQINSFNNFALRSHHGPPCTPTPLPPTICQNRHLSRGMGLAARRCGGCNGAD